MPPGINVELGEIPQPEMEVNVSTRSEEQEIVTERPERPTFKKSIDEEPETELNVTPQSLVAPEGEVKVQKEVESEVTPQNETELNIRLEESTLPPPSSPTPQPQQSPFPSFLTPPPTPPKLQQSPSPSSAHR